jgi:DNA-binding response OmpR family regulator
LPRIFVVDDESGITAVCSIALEDNGFTVDAYNDPKEALAAFKKGYYDLLIIDIMPGMNGFDLYREIKKIDDKSRVVFMTAFENYENEALKVFLNINNNLLKKPFEMAELVSDVRKELSRERAS